MAKRAVFLVIGAVAFVLACLAGRNSLFAQEEKTEPIKKEEVVVSNEAKLAFDKGMEFYRQSKYDEAIGAFSEATKVEPKYAQAYCEMGIAQMEKNDFEGAIPNLLKSIELQPTYPKAHYAVAVSYARQKAPDTVNARKHVDIASQQGYMVVPWFLDYLKRLEEGQTPPENN